jgi:hypothetical protein
MDYKKHIGDGKLPNHYWVFHYDEKFCRNEDGELESNNDTELQKDSLLGEFKTYKEALQCVDTKAYYPHITIEDRISGQVFESIVIVCPCCGKEDYETFSDINYTRDAIQKKGFSFE